MRQSTQMKIDALHAEIADLVEAEKKHYDKENPADNDLWRHIAHTKIENQAHSPKMRALRIFATASFPR